MNVVGMQMDLMNMGDQGLKLFGMNSQLIRISPTLREANCWNKDVDMSAIKEDRMW